MPKRMKRRRDDLSGAAGLALGFCSDSNMPSGNPNNVLQPLSSNSQNIRQGKASVEGSDNGPFIARASDQLRSRRKRSPTRWKPHLCLTMLCAIAIICPAAIGEDIGITLGRQLQQQNVSTMSPPDQALQDAEKEDEEIQQQTETEMPTEEPVTFPEMNFNSFPHCNYTTQELTKLAPEDEVNPCILFDIQPERLQIIPFRTTVVTLVQVTPNNCYNQRDGTTTSVEFLNRENGGKGIAVGFNKDYYVQFRLVSVIAGNSDHLGAELYGLQHSAVLKAAVTALNADYIVGSCSFAAAHEKQPALETQRMVLTQVGPPGFYKDNNPYVFGVHINSDEYPIPTVRALGFQAADVGANASASLNGLPVRVLYRTQSAFFKSTCQSALRGLHEVGFTDIKDIPFDPDADDDGDGVANALDPDFLIALADETCPPGSGDYDKHANPAIFACLLKEQDIILERWKQNGCRPMSLWLTAATWGWASANPGAVPYMFGGGQWHEAFDYSDRFFQSGREVLAYNEEKFGYYGSYDAVVSYAVPMIFAEHIESFYRVVDDPDPSNDFKTEEGYEALRRAMVVLNTDTIFGPLSYNYDQRNNGRGAAGTQWQTQNIDGESIFRNVLVSPFLQAEAESKIPAPSAVNCTPGYYVNETLVTDGDAILASKCDACPVNTFTPFSNQLLQCHTCPKGSTTGDLTGEAYCIQENDNLLNAGALSFGYLAVCITWILSIGFIGWLVKKRKHPVVLLSQFEFMVMVCVGAFISSSTIIALSIQAGSDEDTDGATIGCQAAPFLYTIGWILQYGSLSAKSFRLAKIMNNQNRVRVTVTAMQTMTIVGFVLALDLIVVIVWTATHPLEYIREVTSVEKDDATHVVTINSSGRCKIGEDGPSLWAFTGPIIAIHAVLMITTNVILYKVRGVADRYQEQKYVALASAFVFEVLIIGLPVLISVGENATAVFIVLTGIIALNDMGMLCFVFIPKIMFQRKKLAEGVAVGETILKATYNKASVRESIRRLPSQHSVFHMPSQASLVEREMREGINSTHENDFAYSREGSRESLSRESSGGSRRPSNNSSIGLGSTFPFESIVEGSCEEESEADFEHNKEQAQRKSTQTPRTDTGTEEDPLDSMAEESDTEDPHRRETQVVANGKDNQIGLSQKFEEAKLNNYGLLLEIEELRDSEEHLKNRVEELESLLKSMREEKIQD